MSEVITITKRNGAFQNSSNLLYNNTGISDDEDGDEKDIYLPDVNSGSKDESDSQIVTPGELVTDDPIWMRGHGTYFLDNMTYSSVAGYCVPCQ